MNWKIYLSGEIHTHWRDELKLGANEANLRVEFLGPETDHDLSDNSGANILGSEDKKFWHDHKGAKINSIRIKRNIEISDIVVVKFGEKYRQWNAAFEAGSSQLPAAITNILTNSLSIYRHIKLIMSGHLSHLFQHACAPVSYTHLRAHET